MLIIVHTTLCPSLFGTYWKYQLFCERKCLHTTRQVILVFHWTRQIIKLFPIANLGELALFVPKIDPILFNLDTVAQKMVDI